MDASKRSRHSNAYFTGIGRVKRIVLYDTLIKQMSHAEIVAVLAHEIGTGKRAYLETSIVGGGLALAGSWLGFKLLAWPGLPGLLGLPADISLPAKMVVLGFVASLALFPLGPFSPGAALPRTGGRPLCLRLPGDRRIWPRLWSNVGRESLQPLPAPLLCRFLLFSSTDGGAGGR
jgi:hypothetical protein